MTTIKLTKETNFLGQEVYEIVDQDNNTFGTYYVKAEAEIGFKKVKYNIERFGDLRKFEVIEEFTHTPKPEET